MFFFIHNPPSIYSNIQSFSVIKSIISSLSNSSINNPFTSFLLSETKSLRPKTVNSGFNFNKKLIAFSNFDISSSSTSSISFICLKSSNLINIFYRVLLEFLHLPQIIYRLHLQVHLSICKIVKSYYIQFLRHYLLFCI